MITPPPICENPLLSVIIPMYNAGGAIERCLDSIDYLESTEVIVIDDGSRDDSVSVVKRYQETHPHVILFQKPNGGVSSARNLGIEKARGRYLAFVDADDYLLPGGLERIVSIAVSSGADVVKYKPEYERGGVRIEGDASSAPISERHIKGRAEALKYFDVSDYYIWDGVYKAGLIKDKGIRFREDLRIREDDIFMVDFYCEAEHVIATDLKLYVYVIDSQHSATDKLAAAEKNNKIVESNVLAVGYRKEIVAAKCAGMDLPYEKYKCMRYVYEAGRTMLSAGFGRKEFTEVMHRFKTLGAWPLSYKWIPVAQYKYTLKRVIRTFLTNHPRLLYLVRKVVRGI